MSSNVSDTTEHTHTHNVFDVSARERDGKGDTLPIDSKERTPIVMSLGYKFWKFALDLKSLGDLNNRTAMALHGTSL